MAKLFDTHCIPLPCKSAQLTASVFAVFCKPSPVRSVNRSLLMVKLDVVAAVAKRPLTSAFPFTSNLYPVVLVALAPTTTISVGSVVYTNKPLVLVLHTALPALVLSVPHEGTPPETLSTVPSAPIPNRVKAVLLAAYNRSPVVYVVVPVPP